MSAKELKLDWPNGNKLHVSNYNDLFHIQLGIDDIFIDRSQAHLLMLFLQEHLGNSVNGSILTKAGYWLCSAI